MKRVTKQQYEEFIQQHIEADDVIPHVSGISEPPSFNHYRKSDMKLMAHTFCYDSYPAGSDWIAPEDEREYYIAEDESEVNI